MAGYVPKEESVCLSVFCQVLGNDCYRNPLFFISTTLFFRSSTLIYFPVVMNPGPFFLTLSLDIYCRFIYSMFYSIVTVCNSPFRSVGGDELLVLASFD